MWLYSSQNHSARKDSPGNPARDSIAFAAVNSWVHRVLHLSSIRPAKKKKNNKKLEDVFKKAIPAGKQISDKSHPEQKEKNQNTHK